MTIEQGAVEAVVKIRPAGPLWIAFFVLGGFMVGLGADALASGRPWFALLGLVLGCCSLAVAYLLRMFGLDLTPEFAIVRDPRPRRVRWTDVQAVVSSDGSSGPEVTLILENDESVSLPYLPKPKTQKGDAEYEGDFHRINQWWLRHRGESWHAVRPESPRPPILE